MLTHVNPLLAWYVGQWTIIFCNGELYIHSTRVLILWFEGHSDTEWQGSAVKIQSWSNWSPPVFTLMMCWYLPSNTWSFGAGTCPSCRFYSFMMRVQVRIASHAKESCDMSAKLSSHSSPLSSFLFLFGCLPVIVHHPAEASPNHRSRRAQHRSTRRPWYFFFPARVCPVTTSHRLIQLAAKWLNMAEHFRNIAEL
jgi:hypothetical protein